MKLMKVIERKDELLQYRVVLAFETKITDEAKIFAQDNKITIMTSRIIYHLFDQYNVYLEKVRKEMYEKMKALIVFPCALEIIPDAIFHTKKPLILGVRVK